MGTAGIVRKGGPSVFPCTDEFVSVCLVLLDRVLILVQTCGVLCRIFFSGGGANETFSFHFTRRSVGRLVRYRLERPCWVPVQKLDRPKSLWITGLLLCVPYLRAISEKKIEREMEAFDAQLLVCFCGCDGGSVHLLAGLIERSFVRKLLEVPY